MTQPDFAAVGGVQKRAQVSYEANERAPDAAYLAAVGEIGVDVQYVLTGSHRAQSPPVDGPLLEACIAAVDTELQSRGLSLEPLRRARLYSAIFQMSLPAGKLNQAAVAPMVNLAAG